MIHRWWRGPKDPNSLWTHPDIVDWSFDVTALPWYLPDRVHPNRELQHQANIARLYLLHEHGGWWVDHDAEILVPLDRLPYPMTASYGGTRRCGCVLGFAAGDASLMIALDEIAGAPPSDLPAAVVSGGRLLSRVLSGAVAAVQLPYWADGHPTGAPPWVVHRFDTSGRVESPPSTADHRVGRDPLGAH